MRGKKIDTEFVSEFILSCAKLKKMNPEDICNEAEMQIKNIDDQIRKVEELKKVRSKLKDVLISLDKRVPDKSKDKDLLSFYGISNISLANNFCLYLDACDILNINSLAEHDIHNVKQMLTINVLKREKDNILPGEKFQSFLKFYESTYKK